MKNLRGIVYVSKAMEDFDEDSLHLLAMKAAIANKKLGVTGYLYYENQHFLQYIEGEKHAVQALMDHISWDHRHEVLKTITSDTLHDRYFPSWNMRFLTPSALKDVEMEEIIIKYIDYLTNQGLEQIEGSKVNVWNMINKLSKLRRQLNELL